MTTCTECGVETIPVSEWMRWTQAERDAAAALGQARRAGRLCARCYIRNWRERNPRQRPSTRSKLWKLEDLIGEAEFLFDGGISGEEVAKRLGIKYRSLAKAYRKARKKGLTTRRVPENSRRKYE